MYDLYILSMKYYPVITLLHNRSFDNDKSDLPYEYYIYNMILLITLFAITKAISCVISVLRYACAIYIYIISMKYNLVIKLLHNIAVDNDKSDLLSNLQHELGQVLSGLFVIILLFTLTMFVPSLSHFLQASMIKLTDVYYSGTSLERPPQLTIKILSLKAGALVTGSIV